MIADCCKEIRRNIYLSLYAVLGAYVYKTDTINVYFPYRRGEYQIVSGKIENNLKYTLGVSF